MTNYIAHIKSKPPHERRKHALQLSAVITAIVFVGWLASLGIRFSSSTEQQADNPDATIQTQLSNVVSGASSYVMGQQANSLVAATSSDYDTGTTATQ